MRISSIAIEGQPTLAVRVGDALYDLARIAPDLPRTLGAWLKAPAEDRLAIARLLERPAEAARVTGAFVYLPLASEPFTMLCLGLNYVDHAAEAAYEAPKYPVVFTRVASSLVGHEQPMILPPCSSQLDYEAELVVVIGRTARAVSRENALDYVAGYTLFNDGSIRDYQRRTHQWTLGKNFDRTGPLGPELVTPDELPPGATGLRIQMRVNGETRQDATTSDMIFGVAETIAIITEAMTLQPGDVIAMGTPSGVGAARTPPVFLRTGDVCEVEVEGIGILRNVVATDSPASKGTP
ncbi:MAG: FAA hydrolase family protein [Proteobacteria bacterium]|nr:MAG: FAA hydrolase family protein [Pseudomonadota bacterium]